MSIYYLHSISASLMSYVVQEIRTAEETVTLCCNERGRIAITLQQIQKMLMPTTNTESELRLSSLLLRLRRF